jgi:sugar transferase EpsL
MTKRVLDLLAALLLLVLLSPVLLVTALAVRFFLGSPVLFRQVRPGLNQRPFTLFKFRSMRDLPPGSPPLSDPERLTRFGRMLRSSSLDELPELVNVLRGDMSLVGPRPLLMQYLPLYSPEQARRHDVRPGITGWAQINGRNALSWEAKFEMDVWYVDHQSLWLDLRILALTVWQVISRRGILPDGGDRVEFFRGSGEAASGSLTSSQC